MVTPIRIHSYKSQSDFQSAGLHVIGPTNIVGENIPKLPELYLSDIKCDDRRYLSVGDVVCVSTDRNTVKTVLSKKCNANTLLLTEQCENRCRFCSQPPNDLPDLQLYVDATLSLLNFNTQDIVGLSGGEPTHNRDAFVQLLHRLNTSGVNTPLHILSNGRSFSDESFLNLLSPEIEQRNILWGIPLYGHRAVIHDQIVESHGAFVETITGLANLGGLGQSIELRIVPSQDNIAYLSNIVQFVANNLAFVTSISVMNMEPKGWARKNYDRQYVVVEQQVPHLERCIDISGFYSIQVSLFNYPLCLLTDELRPYAVKSISDWKNYYPSTCHQCNLYSDCGGFFSSAYGRFIEETRPIQ